MMFFLLLFDLTHHNKMQHLPIGCGVTIFPVENDPSLWNLHVLSTPRLLSVPQPDLLLLTLFLPPPPLAFVPWTGCPRGRPHHQLPAGEVPGGPSEPRGEELPRLLSDDRGRRGRPAEAPRLGEEHPAVPVPGQGESRALFEPKAGPRTD